MKVTVYITFFILLLLTSCTEQPEEKVIKEFMKKIGDPRSNLGIDILELNYIGTVVGSDSARVIDSELYHTTQRLKTNLNVNSEIIWLTKAKKKYEQNPRKTLANKYRCRYKVKDPESINAKREITSIFLLDTLNKKVLEIL